MADAISANANALSGLPGVQLIAGYDTGTADIRWTPATWAMFPSLVHVHIDQGGPGAPVYSANVMDIETGAWSPAQAGPWCSNCTAPRPTIYCNRSNLAASFASAQTAPRFQGDVWLAYPGWQPGQSLPVLPGIRYAAVQNQLSAGGGLYDLSVVLDPAWPETGSESMPYPQFAAGYRTCYKCSAVFFQPTPAGWANVCPAGGAHSSGVAGTADTISMVVDGITQAGQ